MSSESSSHRVPRKIDTGTRFPTVFTAISAPSLRSAMVRLSDSALWCGQAMAGAPWRTWNSTILAKPSASKLKSSLSGVTGACMTPLSGSTMSRLLPAASLTDRSSAHRLLEARHVGRRRQPRLLPEQRVVARGQREILQRAADRLEDDESGGWNGRRAGHHLRQRRPLVFRQRAGGDRLPQLARLLQGMERVDHGERCVAKALLVDFRELRARIAHRAQQPAASEPCT